MRPSGPPFADEPPSVLSALAARLENGESVDLERWCAEHPDLESRLRRFHRGWRRADGLLGRIRVDSGMLDSAEREASGRGDPLDAASKEAIDRLTRPDRGLARYEVKERIGRGGMGEVWRVYDRDLRRELAMKVLRSRASDGRRLRRFLHEAQLTARLDHPGIVPVHDLGVDETGRLWFTMPLVRGQTLSGIFERTRAERDASGRSRSLEVILKLCDTIAFAHAAGVVHRDLKPSNVMVGRFGEAYVVDWGLAIARGSADSQDATVVPVESGGVESAGDVVGTPAYMAPEQAAGEEVGVRADVYSLGAILYELLAGRRPYQAHEASGFDAVLAAVRAGPPLDLGHLASDAPAELAAVCRKAMARDLAERYGDCGELAADLRAYLDGRVVRAHASGALAELRKWVGRNRALATALIAALLSTIGGLTAVWRTEARGKAELLRLADARRLAELEAEAERLWPAVPSNVGSLEQWLARAAALADRRARHAEDLVRLRADRSADAEGRWRLGLLEELVEDLGRFADPTRGTIASVRDRHAFAAEIHEKSLVSGAKAWRTAIDSIANQERCPRYRGLVIEPQLGLLPLGRDPRSGLWEFADLSSGVAPLRGADGTLSLSADSAIVLVLIPPGEFEMGSRDGGLLVGRSPREEETPARTHRVAAFFLAKHELTRAQWARARSGWPRGPIGEVEDALLPAAGLSWDEALSTLLRFGLALPTEEQWEYAARADTRSRWWTGETEGSLAGCANGAPGPGVPAGRAPERPIRVDRLRANPFGLHSVHGNVAEWAAEAWRPSYAAPDAEVDFGLRPVRGGNYASPPSDLRSAARLAFARDVRSPGIGVRPARALSPPAAKDGSAHPR